MAKVDSCSRKCPCGVVWPSSTPKEKLTELMSKTTGPCSVGISASHSAPDVSATSLSCGLLSAEQPMTAGTEDESVNQAFSTPCHQKLACLREQLDRCKELLKLLEHQEQSFMGVSSEKPNTAAKVIRPQKTSFEVSMAKDYLLVPGHHETLLRAGEKVRVFASLSDRRWRCASARTSTAVSKCSLASAEREEKTTSGRTITASQSSANEDDINGLVPCKFDRIPLAGSLPLSVLHIPQELHTALNAFIKDILPEKAAPGSTTVPKLDVTGSPRTTSEKRSGKRSSKDSTLSDKPPIPEGSTGKRYGLPSPLRALFRSSDTPKEGSLRSRASFRRKTRSGSFAHGSRPSTSSSTSSSSTQADQQMPQKDKRRPTITRSSTSQLVKLIEQSATAEKNNVPSPDVVRKMSLLAGRDIQITKPVKSTGIGIAVGDSSSDDDSDSESQSSSKQGSVKLSTIKDLKADVAALPIKARMRRNSTNSCMDPPKGDLCNTGFSALVPEQRALSASNPSLAVHQTMSTEVERFPSNDLGKGDPASTLSHSTEKFRPVSPEQAPFSRTRSSFIAHIKGFRRRPSKSSRGDTGVSHSAFDIASLPEKIPEKKKVTPPMDEIRTFQVAQDSQGSWGFTIGMYNKTFRDDDGSYFFQRQVFVEGVTEGESACLSGVVPGDAILEIGGDNVEDQTPEEVLDLLNKHNDTVRLMVKFVDGCKRRTLEKKLSTMEAELQAYEFEMWKICARETSITSKLEKNNTGDESAHSAEQKETEEQQETHEQRETVADLPSSIKSRLQFNPETSTANPASLTVSSLLWDEAMGGINRSASKLVTTMGDSSEDDTEVESSLPNRYSTEC